MKISMLISGKDMHVVKLMVERAWAARTRQTGPWDQEIRDAVRQYPEDRTGTISFPRERWLRLLQLADIGSDILCRASASSQIERVELLLRRMHEATERPVRSSQVGAAGYGHA